MVSFTFLDQVLHLYPERALYWVEGKTLVVADIHFGKVETFQAHGIALPAGATQDNLTRLSTVLDESKADRLLILGDLIHAKAGRTALLEEQVAAWRQQYGQLVIDLVHGNHDRYAGQPPVSWHMRGADRLVEPPFVWQHHPASSVEGYVVAGHLHPGVQLRAPGEALTLPCFYFGETYLVLPAFGNFTGFSLVRPKPNEPVFIIADDEIIRLA